MYRKIGFLLIGMALAGCGGALSPAGSSGADGSSADAVPCSAAERCGGQCCGADEICSQDRCQPLGQPCDELWPCPEGYYCDGDSGRCQPGATKCEYRPPTGVFSPEIEWSWTGGAEAPEHDQVMMAPMVANLTDDNGDGRVDRDDVPDIVFISFAGSEYWGGGVLRAISGDGSKEHFAVTDPDLATTPGAGVAIGDIDNDGKPDIVTCLASTRVTDTEPARYGLTVAFNADGTLKWKATDERVTCGFAAPALADLDGDGTPEVVVRYAALEGPTGKTRWVAEGLTDRRGDLSTVADVDEDGLPEVVGGNVVYGHDGERRWIDEDSPDGYPALADLDGDGDVEIVTVASSAHALLAHHHDGRLMWGPVDVNQGHAAADDRCEGCGGGPPTIADFDGDGAPEIAAAGGYGYVIFDADGSPKWFSATQDLSSRATGSSVFDFEGDGKAEVVYGDELVLRIYDGTTSETLYSRCNTSGTLWEYPVIVDVDNDGHAEIVVANNNYGFSTCADGSPSATGIRVLSDGANNWVRTRRIWNQHSYHVTNIDEDGRIPPVEARNWDNPHLNNFRQNVQPGGLFDAPDLRGTAAAPACMAQVTVDVVVSNDGAAKIAAKLLVTLYGRIASQPVAAAVALQTVPTATAIAPGQSATVSFSAPTPVDFRGQTVHLHAVVDDDGTGAGTANECKEDNNTVEVGDVECSTVN